MANGRRYGFGVVALAIVLGAGWFIVQKKQAAPAAPATSAAPQALEFLPSDIAEIRQGEVDKLLSVSGALRAVNQAAVKARVAGEVREVLVREGERVVPGQILIRMETADYAARVEQARGALEAARGQLEIARSAYDNNQALLTKNYISKNAFDNAKNQYAIATANVDSARGALDVAQKALQDTVIRAPIGGLISGRSVQPGEKVSPDNRLLDIVDLRTLEMEAPVPTQDIASIRIGQSVQLQVDGVPTRVGGTVARINPATVAGSRSIMAYIQFANPDQVLRAGMFGTAQLVVEKKQNVLSVPQTALQREGERVYVYTIENNLLAQKPLKLGLEGAAGTGDGAVAVTEVLSGLAGGERVVRTNLGSLRPGMPVKLLSPRKE